MADHGEGAVPANGGSRWFRHERVHPSIQRLWEPHVHPFFRANIWFVQGREADLVIDFGMGLASLSASLQRNASRPLLAVATHVHVDHVGSFHEFDERLGHRLEAEAFAAAPDSSTLAHMFRDLPHPVSRLPAPGWAPEDFTVRSAPLTRVLEEGDAIDIGDFSFRVLHLPGHSPGSIGLLDEDNGILFSGDAVYPGTLVDDIPGADIERYIETMRRLMALRVDTVFGGHNHPVSGEEMRAIAARYVETRAAGDDQAAQRF